MNNKTVKIVIAVNMFAISTTHVSYINIDSVTHTTALCELGIFSTILFYSNMKLQGVDCYRCDGGHYFSNILNVTDNI